jgi:hypothetical protein
MPALHIYKVSYSLPRKQGYIGTGRRTVLAHDIEDALTTVRAEHPDAHLWSCGHHGQVDLISPKALAGLIEEVAEEHFS